MQSSEVSSATQDNWQEITQALRAALAKRINDIGLMSPTEIRDFTEALRNAMDLEEDAHIFDKFVELYLAKTD